MTNQQSNALAWYGALGSVGQDLTGVAMDDTPLA